MHKDHNLQSTDAHCQLGYHLGDGAAYFRAGISMTRWAVLAEGLWNRVRLYVPADHGTRGAHTRGGKPWDLA